jgi:hypothetical protein|tara:strand:+ start:1336 stop:1506 length:171 start_codon:yes stop_codon:yes gene_type:complete
MEDLLYEIHGKGLLDEVYAYAKVLREQEKYKHIEYIDVLKKSYAHIEKMKSIDNKC